jgi:hypothetical protein
MKTIELLITDSNEKSKNLSLKIGGKDVGILYLSNEEYYDFVKILRKGCDLECELIEPLDDIDLEDED